MTVYSNVKQSLATVKGIETQLSTLALNAMDEKAQQAFHQAMLLVGEIKQDLQIRIHQMEREEPQYKPN
ncbi:NADH dehydrogenase [Weizmannia acidilactici]|uniref:NADH dehydrogenase n=1 Tax=Weizmannia acidilactici TaxID=2607726 RepID=A0A5J4JJ19_9BACI|nr:DUF1657 domain-containing protein [Weizmannia acidilactici]GER68193.1 NADH dehydrogenase [Weizmannia acidilactici]GER70540.1 NADH dehydrogenase [Weizmannia acidilactici]GER73172.1 NADH dehydrogenase [Weizmannia acidilactici]